MTQPPPRDRTQAGVAFLADARKRRRRPRRKPAPSLLPVEPQQVELAGHELGGCATDLATDLAEGLLPQAEDVTGGADAILAQHEAAAEASASAPAVEERVGEAPADEILLALDGHHERVEPHQRHAAPRGSADLDAHQAQQPRDKRATRVRPTFKRPSRRLLASSAVAAALVAIAITVDGNSPSAPSKAARQLAAISSSTGPTTLAAGNFPAHGLLAAHHQTTSHASPNNRTRHHAHRSKPSAPRYSTAGAAGGSSGTPIVTASSGAANNTPQQSDSATPAATDSQSTSGSSSGGGGSAPAGPAGAGGTVGGNCNPKCS